MNSDHYQINDYESHARLLADSFLKTTGSPLLLADSTKNILRALEEAPFAVVSHGTEADPIFNFANHQALHLFELDFESFIQLPSRKSAEPMNQVDRNRLLKEVSDHGFIANYSGVRISSTGKRFKIRNAVVWNVRDEQGKYCGQAAKLTEWISLEDN